MSEAVNSKFDLFQYWLMDMPDALSRMIKLLPNHISEKLDYSIDSLDILESWILEQYPTVNDILLKDQAQIVDGYARYVGQTFRKYLGGKWMIELNDPKHIFYNIPQIQTDNYQDCPLTLVTASTDRRTGHYFSDILRNFLK